MQGFTRNICERSATCTAACISCLGRIVRNYHCDYNGLLAGGTSSSVDVNRFPFRFVERAASVHRQRLVSPLVRLQPRSVSVSEVVQQCVFYCSERKLSRTSWHGQTRTEHFSQVREAEIDLIHNQTERYPRLTISEKAMHRKANFGILFDVDGVIARGANPLTAAQRMIKLLTDENNKLVVPIAFVSNATGIAADKVKTLSKWLDTEIPAEQMILAQSPLSVFHSFHKKRVLFVGQGNLQEIGRELGFTDVATIEEVKDAFPLLDIVDHRNRQHIAANGVKHSSKPFRPVEAIILIGEPTKWETNLQLLVDLLLTGGHPSLAPRGGFIEKHIPVLACNMDLVFMADACMPRFGHGAFLVCLESLFKKITGYDLQYTALIGKPSEITFRFAEHCISNMAKRLGLIEDITTLYIVGDNPEVDVYGANLYNKYIEECQTSASRGGTYSSRQVPNGYDFNKQTVTKCHSILVETGVYDPKIGRIEEQEHGVYHHGHRDFELDHSLKIPTMYATDVYDAVINILERELCIHDKENNNMLK